MKSRTGVLFTCAAVILGLAVAATAYAATITGATVTGTLPKAQWPAVVTTCGQSPGALAVKMLCDMVAKGQCTEEDEINATEFATMVKSKKIKTLFITMGTSLKGMGAAGIDIDMEVNRVKGLIDVANKNGVTVIGMQVEGASRRTDDTDEQSIQCVAPNADLIIIRNDVDSVGNPKGYFAKLAKDKKIPLVVVDTQMTVPNVLKEVFK